MKDCWQILDKSVQVQHFTNNQKQKKKQIVKMVEDNKIFFYLKYQHHGHIRQIINKNIME